MKMQPPTRRLPNAPRRPAFSSRENGARAKSQTRIDAPGFTLLEMVLVVAILTILATVALRSMEGVDQQARFEGTQQTMRNVNDAVLSCGQQGDGSFLISGFVADMGRLPRAFGTEANTQLQELWANPRGLQPFAVRAAPSDPEVLVPCGWRGNYLQLGVGQSGLHDAWGAAMDLLKADGTAAADGDPVAAIRSRGADGSIDAGVATGYDTDIALTLGGNMASTAQGGIATLSGRVLQLDANSGQLRDPDPANGDVVIRYFAPDSSTGLPAEQAVTVAAPFTSVSFTFAATAGPRVVRAYQGSPVTLRSVPVRLVLQPGGQARDLVLR